MPWLTRDVQPKHDLKENNMATNKNQQWRHFSLDIFPFQKETRMNILTKLFGTYANLVHHLLLDFIIIKLRTENDIH